MVLTVRYWESSILLGSDADFLCDLGQTNLSFYLPTLCLFCLFRLYWVGPYRLLLHSVVNALRPELH